MVRCKLHPLRDLVAGIVLAVSAIPYLIAYAENVGYGGARGLGTAGLPLLAWGAITGSPYLTAGVTSMTAIMAKSDLDGDTFVRKYGQDKYVRLVAAYSLYIGLASILLASVGFGAYARRAVPSAIRVGLMRGLSMKVLIAAIPNGLLEGGLRHFQDTILRDTILGEAILKPWKERFPVWTGAIDTISCFYILSHPRFWGVASTLIFFVGTSFLVVGKKFLPKGIPPGTDVFLLAMTASIFSSSFEDQAKTKEEIPTDESGVGISLLGLRLSSDELHVKDLLHESALVEHFWDSWMAMMVSATLFAGINFLSIQSVATVFNNEDGIPWSPSRELFSQGVACVVAALVGSAPVSVSMPRSYVSRLVGSTSQLACLVTALVLIGLQPAMGLFVSRIPTAALSAVVVGSVLNGDLLHRDLIASQNATKRNLDVWVSWGTAAMVLLTSPTIGFVAALAVFSLYRWYRRPALAIARAQIHLVPLGS